MLFFAYNAANTSEKLPLFIITFILMYLFYTAFEIYLLIHNLRTEFKNNQCKH